MNVKDVKAENHYVVLKMEKTETGNDMYKKKGKIFVPNENEKASANPQAKVNWRARIYDVGPEVSEEFKQRAEENKDQFVFFNDYDCKYIGDEENMFALVQEKSVMAFYTPGE